MGLLHKPWVVFLQRLISARLLKDALAAGVIRLEDEAAAPKLRRYVPHWA